MARCCDCAVQRNEACSACVSGVQRWAAHRAVPAQRSAPLGFSSGSSVACVLRPQPQCCHRRQASRAVRSRRTAVTVTARLPEPELWRRPCRAAPNATRRRRSRPQPAARTRRKRSGWRRRAAPPAAQPAHERCTKNALPAQAVAKSSSQQTVAACRRRAGVPTRHRRRPGALTRHSLSTTSLLRRSGPVQRAHVRVALPARLQQQPLRGSGPCHAPGVCGRVVAARPGVPATPAPPCSARGARPRVGARLAQRRADGGAWCSAPPRGRAGAEPAPWCRRVLEAGASARVAAPARVRYPRCMPARQLRMAADGAGPMEARLPFFSYDRLAAWSGHAARHTYAFA